LTDEQWQELVQQEAVVMPDRQLAGMRERRGTRRPILLIDETHRMTHVFATGPHGGGAICEKTSPLDNISFATGLGTPVIEDAASPHMGNASSTKQNVNSTTGIVVLASADTTQYYWHMDESLTP
jgi:hypothetical protein